MCVFTYAGVLLEFYLTYNQMVVNESFSLKNCVLTAVRELHIYKKESFILCVNVLATGVLYSKTASSFVQGIYHDFPHSTLTHLCSVTHRCRV